jgi:uncharacterized protein (DUF1810 family)
MTAETNGEANDPYRLQRFVDAQASCFGQVRSELLAGQKQTHWMWFIFPQLRGLGLSPMAQRFAISGPDEAHAYLLHPVLGERLRDCTALVNAVDGRSVGDIFGHPDNLKFHSSVTLFAWVVGHGSPFQMLGNHVFADALAKYFNGVPDKATIDRLQSQKRGGRP